MALAPTPCFTNGCNNHTTARGYCELHQPKTVFRSQRGADLPKDWNTRRAIVLRRDHNICYVCQGTATQVDHVTPGNNHTLENLKAICMPCHMTKTAREGNEAKQANKTKRRH